MIALPLILLATIATGHLVAGDTVNTPDLDRRCGNGSCHKTTAPSTSTMTVTEECTVTQTETAIRWNTTYVTVTSTKTAEHTVTASASTVTVTTATPSSSSTTDEPCTTSSWETPSSRPSSRSAWTHSSATTNYAPGFGSASASAPSTTETLTMTRDASQTGPAPPALTTVDPFSGDQRKVGMTAFSFVVASLCALYLM